MIKLVKIHCSLHKAELFVLDRGKQSGTWQNTTKCIICFKTVKNMGKMDETKMEFAANFGTLIYDWNGILLF